MLNLSNFWLYKIHLWPCLVICSRNISCIFLSHSLFEMNPRKFNRLFLNVYITLFWVSSNFLISHIFCPCYTQYLDETNPCSFKSLLPLPIILCHRINATLPSRSLSFDSEEILYFLILFSSSRKHLLQWPFWFLCYIFPLAVWTLTR